VSSAACSKGMLLNRSTGLKPHGQLYCGAGQQHKPNTKNGNVTGPNTFLVGDGGLCPQPRIEQRPGARSHSSRPPCSRKSCSRFVRLGGVYLFESYMRMTILVQRTCFLFLYPVMVSVSETPNIRFGTQPPFSALEKLEARNS
jgi:hypothetical protein